MLQADALVLVEVRLASSGILAARLLDNYINSSRHTKASVFLSVWATSFTKFVFVDWDGSWEENVGPSDAHYELAAMCTEKGVYS